MKKIRWKRIKALLLVGVLLTSLLPTVTYADGIDLSDLIDEEDKERTVEEVTPGDIVSDFSGIDLDNLPVDENGYFDLSGIKLSDGTDTNTDFGEIIDDLSGALDIDISNITGGNVYSNTLNSSTQLKAGDTVVVAAWIPKELYSLKLFESADLNALGLGNTTNITCCWVSNGTVNFIFDHDYYELNREIIAWGVKVQNTVTSHNVNPAEGTVDFNCMGKIGGVPFYAFICIVTFRVKKDTTLKQNKISYGMKIESGLTKIDIPEIGSVVSFCAHKKCVCVPLDDKQHSKVCSDCQTEFTEEHVYDDGKITKAPTCQSLGEMIYTCTGCGYEKKMPVPYAECNGDEVVLIEATCAMEGYIKYCCSVCHSVQKTESIRKLRTHTYGKWVVTKQPTARMTGIKTRTCSVCGKVDLMTIAPYGGSTDTGSKSTSGSSGSSGGIVFESEEATDEDAAPTERPGRSDKEEESTSEETKKKDTWGDFLNPKDNDDGEAVIETYAEEFNNPSADVSTKAATEVGSKENSSSPAKDSSAKTLIILLVVLMAAAGFTGYVISKKKGIL